MPFWLEDRGELLHKIQTFSLIFLLSLAFASAWTTLRYLAYKFNLRQLAFVGDKQCAGSVRSCVCAGAGHRSGATYNFHGSSPWFLVWNVEAVALFDDEQLVVKFLLKGLGNGSARTRRLGRLGSPAESTATPRRWRWSRRWRSSRQHVATRP